jgi:hypothetical protein
MVPVVVAAKVGELVVLMDCGVDSVTAPVEADAMIWSDVPVSVVTPALPHPLPVQVPLIVTLVNVCAPVHVLAVVRKALSAA